MKHRLEKIDEKNINKEKNNVFMEKVCSMEYYKKQDGYIKQVLVDISFVAKSGETWVVTGDSLFEIKLFLEIMANTKPYQKGKCILVETGMMRKKRIILNHTFYIGNINMPFNNMKVLEYLMLVTGKQSLKPNERQAKLLDLLIHLELSYIALSEINLLKNEEKSIITLLVSAISNSELIVFNIPMLNFNERQKKAIKNIEKYIKSQNKTLIFSTIDKVTADFICDNILILNKGKVKFKGRKNEFVEIYDKVICRVNSVDNEELIKYLKENYSNFKYRIEEKGVIEVFEDISKRDKKRDIYNGILESGVEILSIEKNILNVKNAYKELVKKDDL